MSKKSDGIEIGLLAGIIGGFIAGILLAPQEGKKSRQKVKNAIIDFGQEHEEDIEKTKKQISESYDLLKYNIERQFRKMINKFRAKKLRKAKEREEQYIYNTDMN